MPDNYITLEAAAAFEGITYKGMASRVARNPTEYRTKTEPREGGGKDQVLISVASLTAKGRKAWRAAQKVDGRDVIIEKRAEAAPWYVDADLNHYIEGHKAAYPRCGELICGVWPTVAAEGRLFASTLEAEGGNDSGDVEFPKVGTFAASTGFWAFGPYVDYFGLASQINAGSRREEGGKDYLRCSGSTYIDADGTFITTEAGMASRAESGVEDYMRCSETTYLAPNNKTEEGFF